MKIKQDFVTNSSSLAVIIFLPDNYQVSKEQIVQTDFYKEYIIDHGNEDDKEDVFDQVDTLLNSLKRGLEIYSNDYSEGQYDWESFGILDEIVSQDGLCIKTFETTGSEGTTMTAITTNDIKKIMANHAEEVFSILSKGLENENKK